MKPQCSGSLSGQESSDTRQDLDGGLVTSQLLICHLTFWSSFFLLDDIYSGVRALQTTQSVHIKIITQHHTFSLVSVLQQNRSQWYKHVLEKKDNNWVKKCTEYKVEGSRPRGIPKKNLEGVVQKD